MCNYFSCVVTKGKKCIWDPKIMSHENLLKLPDDNLAIRQFVKIEIVPKSDKITRNKKDWQYEEDEDGTLPDWYILNKEKFIAMCWAAWEKSIRTNLLIDNEHKKFVDEYAMCAGHSTSEHWNNSTSLHRDNSTSEHWNNSRSEHRDNSVSVHRDNSKSEHWDNSTSMHWDNSRSEHRDNSVSVHRDNSKSEHWDNSTSEHWNNSRSEHMNYSVGHIFNDIKNHKIISNTAVLIDHNTNIIWVKKGAIVKEMD